MLLPLYPLWYDSLDLRDSPLVISSSIAFTHGVRTSGDGLHVCYTHTPMRYAWSLDPYLERSSYGPGSRLAARAVRPFLRRWDRRAARRPDVVVAISETVRQRIARRWRRESEMIHPPVDVDEIALSARDDGYLLVASRMLAYRRLDLAIDACRQMGRRLVVVGDGPERKRLQALAGPHTRFVGHVPRRRLLELFAGCTAYVVPGEEDFGIAPVEAMAAGKPVLAFRAGGVTETVIDGETGVFFDEPSVDALIDGHDRLIGLSYDRQRIRARATDFGRPVFRERWRSLLTRSGVEASLLTDGESVERETALSATG
jgi:glycosyltransferase involved in cell wall biosynthesis